MDLTKLTDNELLSLKKNLEYDISKYNNFQLVRKIQLNSAYGAIGNEWFRYYSTELAEAITLSGQLAIQWIGNELNKYINMDSNKLTNFSDITDGYPKAMDKGHDGPDAQIVLADYIYKQLLKRHEKIIPIKDAKFLSLKDFPVSHKKLFEQTNQWYKHEMGLDYYYGLRT